ncbi:MAG TPA: hypothetical protein VJH96_01495 [Patescibacteria group bacterium]|nr:hypothetical protein [Patescibacteria group bacterium]
MKNSTPKKITIAGLALMVAKGFDKMDEKMDKGFKEMRTDISSLKTDVGEIKLDIKDIKADLNKKVDKIEYNTLEYRVEKLEKKPV